jgi:dolichol-phosphate mannosyltransferase
MSDSLLTIPIGSLQVGDLISVDDPKDDIKSEYRNLPNQPLQEQHQLTIFSLVVPTYNESQNLAKLVEILTGLLNTYFCDRPASYELIIVDDDSPDLTWQVGLELMPSYPQLRVMRRQGEKGLSTAVIRGWQAAQGDVLGVIDGDLQHPPETLIAMLHEMQNGADLVVASRHVEGGGVSDWGLIRRLLSRGAQMLGLLILPHVIGRVSDPMSGYFMVRRKAIANCTMNPLGYKILIEVLGRGNIDRVAEVGYIFQERQEGESKVTWRQYVDYILHLLRLRSRGRIGKIRAKLQIPLQRFIRFGLVGLSGVFVDMAILFLLSDASTLAWGLTRSKIIASEVAIINNFIWNDIWTFYDFSSSQSGWRKRIKRFAKFNLICLFGIGLNLIILNTLYNYFGVNKYLANLIAIAVVTVWNFWFNLNLSWRVTQTK